MMMARIKERIPLLQRIGQGVDIIGNAAEHIPVFMRIKIANRQTLYLFLQRLAQIVGRILNGIGQHERHDDLRDGLDGIKDRQDQNCL